MKRITDDRRLPDAFLSLDFLNRHEHVILVGPVGVGKSFLAQAIGYAAVRAGHSVRSSRADTFFRTMAQLKVDHTLEKTFRSFINPDLLILNDSGLQKLTALRTPWMDSCLSFFDFPEEEWISLRTANVIEQLNKEFKRRTKPMEIVAGENACYTLLAFISITMEMHWRSNPLGKGRYNLPSLRSLIEGYFTQSP